MRTGRCRSAATGGLNKFGYLRHNLSIQIQDYSRC